MTPARGGVLDAIEEAEQALRSASPGWLGLYLAGTVPYAVALLFFITDMRLNRDAVALCGPEALLVTAAYLWMNCARAICAGRLLRRVAGESEPPWTATRAMNLVATQSFFPALKLVALPVAVVLTLPLAAVVAFFRGVTTYADAAAGIEDVARRARRQSLWQQGANWRLLAVFCWLWLVALVNLAVAFAMLPQLARMLFGYETVFSVAPAQLLNSTFVLVVILSAWAALDPLIQVCYVLRCFHGESVETGADVRAVFRRVAAAVVAVLCVAGTVQARAVSPEELDQSIERTLEAREYSWRLPRDQNPRPPSDSAFLRGTERAVAALQRAMQAIGRVIWQVVEWLKEWLSGRPDPARPGAPAPSAPLRISLALLLVLVIALGLVIAWRVRRTRRRPASAAAQPAAAPVNVHDESLTADRLPEEQWLALAEEQIASGDLRGGLRALYLGHLAWLGRAGLIGLDACKTNREYQRELLRRARGIATVEAAFAANVRAFESVWYGAHPATVESVTGFRERVAAVRSALQPMEQAR